MNAALKARMKVAISKGNIYDIIRILGDGQQDNASRTDYQVAMLKIQFKLDPPHDG